MGSVWTGATALVTSLALMGAAAAAPASRCAKDTEVTAIQAAAIQQELMVAALTCNQIQNFNAFQVGFATELRSSDATLLKMFKRLYGPKKGDAEYHSYKTRVANDASMRSIHDNAGYCSEAGHVFEAALGAARPTLAAFVSNINVVDASPVDSCQLRVAATIAGKGAAPFVVPKPKPADVLSAQALAPATAQ